MSDRAARPLRALVSAFEPLRSSDPALFVVYVLKLLESVAYFAIYNVLVVYLSEDLAYGDVAAGSIAGAWLMVNAVVMLASGFIADSIGIRRALLLGAASCFVGRSLLAFGDGATLALAGLFLSSWGVGSMIPTMTAAVRRFAAPRAVPLAFGIFYAVLNVGAFLGPLAIAWLRHRVTRPMILALPLLGPTRMTSSQMLFAIGALATGVALVLTHFGIRSTPHDRLDESAGPTDAVRSPISTFLEVINERTFFRFLGFVTLLVFVRLIFQHAHLTWPKYTLREFDPNFPFAAYWSIDPLLVIVLTPVASALVRRTSAFSSIVVGGAISGFSVMFMALSTTVEASVAFIVTLALGEVLWGPRLYEYAATIAPKGRSASYMGLSQLPMFVAKPFAGFLSGVMLAHYCPAEGARSSRTMWLIIALSTLVGPILIVVLRRFIESKPIGSAGEGEGEPPGEKLGDARARQS